MDGWWWSGLRVRGQERVWGLLWAACRPNDGLDFVTCHIAGGNVSRAEDEGTRGG